MAWCRSFSSAVTWTQREEDLHKIVVRARRVTKANRIAGLLLRLFLCLKQQGLHLASRFGFRVEEGLRILDLGIWGLKFAVRDRQPPATCCPILVRDLLLHIRRNVLDSLCIRTTLTN